MNHLPQNFLVYKMDEHYSLKSEAVQLIHELVPNKKITYL